VNEYVTKFIQLSRYAPNEVDTDEKKQDCFLNDLNDGLAYALEARDFENFQGMANKALVLENHRVVMERKHKLVRKHQLGNRNRPPVLLHLQLDLCSVLLSHNFSRDRSHLDKDSLPRSVKIFSAPTITRPLLLGVRIFR
jgi:hypothetical protein